MIPTAFHTKEGPVERSLGPISRSVLIIVLAAIMSQMVFLTPVEGLTSTDLQKGGQLAQSFIVSIPEGGGRDPSLSIPLPGGGPVQSGSLMVSTVPGRPAPYLLSMDIGLDSRSEWAFGGGEFGGFGLQDRFVGDEDTFRSIGASGGYTFSILLPERAVIREASIGIVSPPSPERAGAEILDLGAVSPGGPDSLDGADIDGDGKEDLVFHDDYGSKVVLVRDPFGNSRSVVLEANAAGPVHTRALDLTRDRSGIIVTSYVDARTQNRMVSLHVWKGGDDLLRVPLSSNLSSDMVGFSLREHEDGNATVVFVSSPKGGLYTADVDREGNIDLRLVMDETKGLIDPYLVDIDGDGDLDIILFGPAGSSPRAAMLESQADLGSIQYSLIDVNTTLGPRGLAAVCDSDGDGTEELYFISDGDDQLALVHFDPMDGPRARTTSINGSGASVRSVPSWLYGRGGIYRGGEGLLYLSSMGGLVQVLPHTGPNGDFLTRRSSGLAPGSIISSLSVDGGGSSIALEEGTGLISQDLVWLWQNSAVITDITSERTVHISIPSPLTGPDVPFDINGLLDPANGALKLTDGHGNLVTRIDMMLSGDDLFLKASDLKVTYDVTFDVSTSMELLPSLLRAQDDFDDLFIPLQVIGSSEGSLEVGPVLLLHDAYPTFKEDMPTVLSVNEDSLARTLLDLKDHISDDQMEPSELELELITLGPTPEGLIFLDRNMDLVSHASAYPDLHGDFPFQVCVSDTRSTVLSKELTLVVTDVEDPPRTTDEFRSVIVEEGSEVVVPLVGEEGFFWDPDGDGLEFTWEATSVMPPEAMDHLTVSIEGGSLRIDADTSGRGSELILEVYADDGRMPYGTTSSIDLKVEVLDIDSPPSKRAWPGVLELSEDQSVPTKVQLEGLFYDPDDDIADGSFRATSSDKRLLAYVNEDRGDPCLFVQPTRDLNGQVKVWVEMTSRGRTVTDELMVNIRPVNDLPVVVVDSKRDLAGKGWMVTGHVEDPDDTGGYVQYMVSEGDWKDAWGFNIWTFVVDFEELPEEGGYVFVRANDGDEDSANIFVKLVPPEKVVPPYDDGPDDVPDDDDTGGPEPPYYIAPDAQGGDDTLLYILFGTAAGLLGTLVISLLLTEVGFVTMLTIVMSAYTKLSKKDILNHEIRGLIRGYIIANPGDHYSSIKRNLDLNNGTLAYHLRVLEQNGLIKSMYDGIYKRYYPANVNISKLKKNISKQEEIFNIILENPGITMEQIGRNIGVSRQVVNYHVKNLIRAGAISYQRDDKSARFYSSETTIISQDT